MTDVRQQICDGARQLVAEGLIQGTSGNVSVVDRARGVVWITPTRMAYATLQPEDISEVDLETGRSLGLRRPSSEVPFHLACHRARPDIGAVVHTHSLAATVMSACFDELPRVHYLYGKLGETIRVAPYATFGSDALAAAIAESLGDADAVLLAHHGVVAVGGDLTAAIDKARTTEFVSRVAMEAYQVGGPRLLEAAEMRRVRDKIAVGGQPAPEAA